MKSIKQQYYIVFIKNKQDIFNINQNQNSKKIKRNKYKSKTYKKKSKVNNPNKRRNSKKFYTFKNRDKSNSINSKTELKKIKSIVSSHHIMNGKSSIFAYNKNNKNKVKEKLIMMKYQNCELNYLDFKKALKYDHRTFGQYYCSLLQIKNLFLFSFYPIGDYNIKIIKIFLFFLFFDIYFAINTLFFNESTIHQIYKDKGEYNLKYFLPQIIYSFIISYFISSIIKFVSLSERNLLQLKYYTNSINFSDKSNKTKKFLILKYILFFILSLLFLILFWYYLSSFCAVYKNSQIYVIKNTLISFTISLVIPFIFILFPSLLRIFSLKNNGNKCFYQLSKIIQYL